MTRRNRCLLSWPSDRGEGIGYQWSFDNFFDGIDSETEEVCDFEEIDGLACPPMDEACLNCDANFNWMMDANFFDGIKNCAPAESKETQECDKNKGSQCGKGKPHSVIVPDLQPPCEDMVKTEAVCDFEEIDGLDCPPMDEAYFKCEANFNWIMDANFFDEINNYAPVDSKATQECNKNKRSRCGRGKPQRVIVPNLPPPGEDMEKTKVVCEFEDFDVLDCPPMDETYFKCEAKFNCMMDEINNCATVHSKATEECNKNKGSQCRKGKPQSLIVHNLQPLCKGKELQKVSKMQNKAACDKGKELKKVVDRYSETKTENQVARGKGKELTKMAADANVEKRYELKLELTKRKLQEDYEKCKKVRKIQLIGQGDLPKPEDPKARSKAVRSFPKRICKPMTVKQRVSQKLRAMGKKKVC